MAVNPQTVTRQRKTTTTDRYGNTVASWATPNELAITGCSIAPDAEDSVNGNGRLGVPVGWTLYRREAADIEAGDRIVASDGTFDVLPEPGRWSSPYSSFMGITVRLHRMEG